MALPVCNSVLLAIGFKSKSRTFRALLIQKILDDYNQQFRKGHYFDSTVEDSNCYYINDMILILPTIVRLKICKPNIKYSKLNLLDFDSSYDSKANKSKFDCQQ